MSPERGRTKVVATVGPASRDPKTLRRLALAGADVFRLNLSHGSQAEHAEAARAVRALGRELGLPLGLLADLQGPKIRIGDMARGGVRLEDGAGLTITTEACPGDASRVSTTYEGLPGDVGPGDRVLVDDGLIELSVEGVEGHEVRCRVVHGGDLSAHKGINLPGVRVSAPALGEKDRSDALFARDLGVDWLALSFVRGPGDVLALKALVGDAPPVVAKVERPEAVEAIGEVLGVADAAMVARGDLGVEAGVEEVPMAQKRIIAAANARAVPVITATQMLDSMIRNPRPTRAEASDVANAILDGTDAVMLSGETASGRFPVEAMETMCRIARWTEAHGAAAPARRPALGDAAASCTEATVHAACEAAQALRARWIVAFSRSGATARLVARERPRMGIVCFTPHEATYRRLALVWGVVPRPLAVAGTTDELIAAGEQELLRSGLASRGDTVVLIAGSNTLPGATNMMKVHRVGEELAPSTLVPGGKTVFVRR
ncbi:MAG: pyruvate kinase [Planctomycetes bacterium]|nr:pyruvate kinase [Planctomycetota bacterium]